MSKVHIWVLRNAMRALLAMSLACAATTVLAAQKPCGAAPAIVDAESIVDASTGNHLGGRCDKHSVTVAILQQFPEESSRKPADPPKPSPPEVSAATLRDAVRRVRGALSDQSPPAMQALRKAHTDLLAALDALSDNMDALVKVEPGRDSRAGSIDRLREANSYAPAFTEDNPAYLLEQLVDGAHQVDLRNVLAGPCAEGSSQACREAVAYMANFHRVAQLSRWIVMQGLTPIQLKAIAPEMARLDAMWDAYFNDARSQTIFEYWINGYFWNRGKTRVEGFPKPPSSQIIFAHPGVSLEYVPGADNSSDRFKPAVHLEVIGYNGWSYDQQTGGIRGARGFSLGILYADRDGAHSVRPLLQFHVNNTLSLGLTHRDGETGVVISAALLEMGTERGGKWRDRFQTAKGWLD
ncbi:MAG TPA: hypothetical protein VGE57_09140 [Solimonas sp.]